MQHAITITGYFYLFHSFFSLQASTTALTIIFRAVQRPLLNRMLKKENHLANFHFFSLLLLPLHHSLLSMLFSPILVRHWTIYTWTHFTKCGHHMDTMSCWIHFTNMNKSWLHFTHFGHISTIWTHFFQLGRILTIWTHFTTFGYNLPILDTFYQLWIILPILDTLFFGYFKNHLDTIWIQLTHFWSYFTQIGYTLTISHIF